MAAVFTCVLVFFWPVSACTAHPNEHFQITKRVQLSPQHSPMPYLMMRASNGDLIVFGSTNQMDTRPWATRVSPEGLVLWEFVQGAPGGWMDHVSNGQRFYSGLELPDGTTLLCGMKDENKAPVVLLDHFSVDGTLIEERLIRPDWDSGILSHFRCVAWNDGIALIGAVSGDPAATGWLAKLAWHLNLEWQKFGSEYKAQEVLEGDRGSFFFLNLTTKNTNGSHASLNKFGIDGKITEQYFFLHDNSPSFVYPAQVRSDIWTTLTLDNGDTRVIHLDSQLRGPTKEVQVRNFAVKKGIELSDGSLALFGSQFLNGATASVARIYVDGSSQIFPVEPEHQSPWFESAVFTGKGDEIAAVRLVDYGRVELDWVSFH